MLNGDYRTRNRWTEESEVSTSWYEEKRNKNIQPILPINNFIQTEKQAKTGEESKND